MAHRIERLNSLIRHEISQLLRLQVKDPRLGTHITVTGASTTSDLKYVRIFISCLDARTEEERQDILNALVGASGFFRNGLKQLRLRHIPEISFRWDDSIERGSHLMDLIDEVTAKEPPPAP